MAQTPANSLDQLRRALDAGLIDQATFEAAAASIRTQLAGSGAIAQGSDALAVGARGVAIKGDNSAVVNTGLMLLIQQAAKPGASRDDLRRAYLARVLTQANQLPLFGGDASSSQVRLSDVYTALLTQRSDVHRDADEIQFGHEKPADREANYLSALDVLNAEPKLVLLGGPGSGKSTFVNFVALSMAGQLLGQTTPNLKTLTAPLPKDKGVKEEPRPQRWEHGALLPVQIVLRDLASQLPAPGTNVNAETLWNYIERRLRQDALADFADVVRDELLAGRGLIFLDGLDEVPDALERRVQIKQAVQEFATTYSGCRFLVTSRTYAYQRQEWKLNGFAEVRLRPFTPGQIDRFVDAWYAHMVELLRLTAADARRRAEVLKGEVERNDRIRELAERPLLLTLIAQLQTEGGGTLPEKREELYDKAVEMLLNKWESLKVRTGTDGSSYQEPSLTEWLKAGRDDIRKQLNRLAFDAHHKQEQLTGTADIPRGQLFTALLSASAKDADVKPQRLEEYLRDRAGILAEHGEGVYQFPHRSFQEYLAACHLTDFEFPDELARLACSDPSRWREVTLLAAAKAGRGTALSVWALADTLCPASAPRASAADTDYWGSLLAGRVLVECADLDQIAPRDRSKLERVRDWQLTIMRKSALPAVERALAGRTLAKLGDPRPEVMTLAAMQFGLVPPGPFTMGDHEMRNEKPQHRVDLDYAYFIARYPVTVAQWREYIRSSDQITDPEALAGRDNDPVTHVSWKDAIRFCRFLTHRRQGFLPKGFVASLPSEAEWEKAARGGARIPADIHPATANTLVERLNASPSDAQIDNPVPARAYPWGHGGREDFANTDMVIGDTSAVGCFPIGRSPYGCEEMSGNVWEWARSALAPYPYLPAKDETEDLRVDDGALRVVRGGSWGDGRDGARCASRGRFDPDDRSLILGFRVVLRCAPAK